MMKQFLLRSAVVILPLAATPAYANIIFLPGNHPQQPSEENVLFEDSEIGLTLANGEVDHSGAGVRFTTLGNPLQIITQKAQGQADIFCAFNCVDNGGNESAQLGSIRMSAGLDANGNPTAWTDAIINLDFGVGTALIHVIDNFGADFPFVLDNGSNFLTMIAINGEFITRIDVTNANPDEPFGFNSFKQPRVSGLCTLVSETSCTPIPTPEPASIALLGVGLLGLGIAATRRR